MIINLEIFPFMNINIISMTGRDSIPQLYD